MLNIKHTLPLTQPRNERRGRAEARADTSVNAPDGKIDLPTVTFTAPDARVLVVDDIPANLIVAKGLLAPYKVTVDTAEDGMASIRAAQANRYDLILMDYMMPGMDGIEAMKRIRQIDCYKSQNIPIVVFTAYVVPGAREMFLQNGFDDYLSKPVDTDKLNDILKKYLPPEKLTESEALSESTHPLEDAGGQNNRQRPCPKKYFVTGGAGFLGINLTRYLLEQGHSVVSFDISPDYDYPEKDDERVTVRQGDIRDIEAVRAAMAGCDIVVHTAAALPLYSEKDIHTTDVDGTRNVLQAALDAGIKLAIMISSTAVYGIPDHHPLVEDDKLVGVGPYGVAKIDAEKVCEEFREKGMIVPILRPKSFIGPERLGVFALFYDWASTGHGFPMIGSGRNRYQLLDVYDLCAATYLCATLPHDIVNDTFNIGAEEFTTMKEDYQAVLDVAGFGKKIRGFPAAPVIWCLRVLELLRLSPLYKWVYETASKDSFVSIEKAKKILGFKPLYSNKDALVRNYKWYLDNVENFSGASGVSHRVPWKQGILGLAKMFF